MNKTKIIAVTAGGVVVIGGAMIAKFDSWFTPEPTGPGSGDELPDDYVEEVKYSDMKDRGRGPGEPGPGSGDELDDAAVDIDSDQFENMEIEKSIGPGSGDELPPDYPDAVANVDTKDYGNGPGVPGPGSGDELPNDYTEPIGPGSGDELPDDYVEPTGPGSGDELTDVFLISNAKFSCNVIVDASTCVEYHGDYWQKTTASLNCSDQGIFKAGACPRPTVGGCRANPGDYLEMITWHYDSGGDPFTAEVLPYAMNACNAMPTADWVSGD